MTLRVDGDALEAKSSQRPIERARCHFRKPSADTVSSLRALGTVEGLNTKLHKARKMKTFCALKQQPVTRVTGWRS
jgi:hypothetical protein